jgi:hypothetical protein
MKFELQRIASPFVTRGLISIESVQINVLDADGEPGDTASSFLAYTNVLDSTKGNRTP